MSFSYNLAKLSLVSITALFISRDSESVFTQISIPLESIAVANSTSDRIASISGFEVDSTNNVYVISNDFKLKKSRITAFSKGKKILDKYNPFLSRKLYLLGKTLITEYNVHNNITIRFIDRNNGILLKTFQIRLLYPINEVLFDKNFIAIEYYVPNKITASYDYYSYDGKVLKIKPNSYLKGSTSFVEHHTAEGALFVGKYEENLVYTGSDLDTGKDKFWITTLSNKVNDSVSVSSLYLGMPLQDLSEFSKIRNKSIWTMRSKGNKIIISKYRLH